jgi:hypothetical protein
MFFFMRDWFREMDDPCLLALDIEVARDNEAVSWFIMVVLFSIVNGEGLLRKIRWSCGCFVTSHSSQIGTE